MTTSGTLSVAVDEATPCLSESDLIDLVTLELTEEERVRVDKVLAEAHAELDRVMAMLHGLELQ